MEDKDRKERFAKSFIERAQQRGMQIELLPEDESGDLRFQVKVTDSIPPVSKDQSVITSVQDSDSMAVLEAPENIENEPFGRRQLKYTKRKQETIFE
jgi:hypothetical protein